LPFDKFAFVTIRVLEVILLDLQGSLYTHCMKLAIQFSQFSLIYNAKIPKIVACAQAE